MSIWSLVICYVPLGPAAKPLKLFSGTAGALARSRWRVEASKKPDQPGQPAGEGARGPSEKPDWFCLPLLICA